MTKIMTLGNGFVANHLPYEKITERIGTNPEFIKALLNLYKPDVIVNCIGRCGTPNIDWCETHKAETYLANTIVPALVAAECEKLGIHFINIASGCIFSGKSPHHISYEFSNTGKSEDYKPYNIDSGWKETDTPNPVSYYSRTKTACDLILGEMSNVSSLRIRMPVSSKNDPRNFINKIRNYKQVIDIPNSITMMNDLVRCVNYIAFNHLTGIYHVTNPQPITAAQVLKSFQKYVPEHSFEVINEKQLDTLTIAKRSNCILSGVKLNKAGFFMQDSEPALEECMKTYFGNIKG